MGNIPAQNQTGLQGQMTKAVKDSKYLSAEEELSLAYRWRDNQDQAALNQIVEAHMRYAIKLAHKYKGYKHVALDDLISEANIGLVLAARKFDPDKGFRFSTYAQWWIRAQIQGHLIQQASLIKYATTAGAKSLFFNYRKARAEIERVDGVFIDGNLNEAQLMQVADRLGVTEAEIKRFENVMHGEMSLDAPLTNADGEEGGTFQDLLDSQAMPADEQIIQSESSALQRQFLNAAMRKLNERERTVFV
jgi:RNA polymerase sigma-32 factor